MHVASSKPLGGDRAPPSTQDAASDARGLESADPPRLNSIVRIDEMRLRVLGVAYDRLVLASTAPPVALFLMPDEDGVPGLVEFRHWARLKLSGRGEEIPARSGRTRAAKAEKIIAQCDLLDGAGVPNGTKSIAIWLHRNWSPELTERFGAPDNPHTLRRWRARKPGQTG